MAKLEYLANKTNSIREYTIRKEIREWSFNWLEEPDDRYNGMSPCPYARRAWNDDKVVISFKHLKSYWPIFDILENFNDNKDLIIIADTQYEEDPDEFHQRLVGINHGIANGAFGDRNLWIMGFHPDDDVHEGMVMEYVDDAPIVYDSSSLLIPPDDEEIYAMIFIQRLDKLQEAAYKLKPTGYYEAMFKDAEPDHIFELRETFYKQLKEASNAH
jgi:hypothetical protein